MSILCATDFSQSAMDAADVAALLAKKLNLSLCLVHFADDQVIMGDIPPVEPDDRRLIEELEAEADRIRAGGVEVNEDYRRGHPARDLFSAAAEHQATLIVLGSAGKGLAERWLIGSVAEEVASQSVVPTLVVRDVRGLLSWLEGEAGLEVLCGIDPVGYSSSAMEWARRLAGLGRTMVGAVQMQPTGETALTAEQLTARQRDVWEAVQPAFGDLPLTVEVRETSGQPARELITIGETRSAGLIVVGNRPHHKTGLFDAGSFSRFVVTHAKTNVLCVPEPVKHATGIPSIQRVLVAVDLSMQMSVALRHAHSLLPSGGAIRCLHVCHEPSRGINPVISSEVYFDHSLATAEERERAEKALGELPESLTQRHGVSFSPEILVHHSVAEAICDAAERFGADVICMGAKGHSRAGVALLGSTVQAVLSRTHKPVFVVTPQPE